MEKVKVISKIEKSELAAPIVTVSKVDRTIRISGDYKVSVNLCITKTLNVGFSPICVFYSHVEELPVCTKDTERATLKDPVLSKV